MTVTAQHRDRLKDVRDRLAQSRKARTDAQNAVRAAREGQDAHAQAVAENRVSEASYRVEVDEELERQMLSQMAGITATGMAAGGFLDDPQTVATLEALAHSEAPIGTLNLGYASSREALVESIQSGNWRMDRMATTPGIVNIPDGARLGPFYGINPQLRRRLSILDLIPTEEMPGGSFDYLQEAGSFDTAAGTADLTLKPEADLEPTEGTVVARTIPHWIKASRPQLADVPGMATIIQSRLTYGVMRRLESQIVAGNGVGQNLLGILSTSGISSVTFSSGEALSDLTLDGIVDTLVSSADPNAVVLNPVDWATMLKAKASGSGQRLDSGGAFATPPSEMWGLPVIPSTAMTQGKALVGDFSRGCTLFVREAVNVRISDSDVDDFASNRITILAEGRFGLAVWQPTAFALVNLTGS